MIIPCTCTKCKQVSMVEIETDCCFQCYIEDEKNNRKSWWTWTDSKRFFLYLIFIMPSSLAITLSLGFVSNMLFLAGIHLGLLLPLIIYWLMRKF